MVVKSLTATTPWVTRVRVVVQLSWTSHLVPRTVAALYWPRVRNLPLPSPQSLRDLGFLDWAALARVFFAGLQPVSFSLRRSSVTSPTLWIVKMPEKKSADSGAAPALGSVGEPHLALARVELGPVRDALGQVERNEGARARHADENRPAGLDDDGLRRRRGWRRGRGGRRRRRGRRGGLERQRHGELAPRLVRVARRVDRTHDEHVVAGREHAEALRRRALPERADRRSGPVEATRHRLRRRERERGRGVRRRAGGPGFDRGAGGGVRSTVNAREAGVGSACRPRRARGPRTCAALGKRGGRAAAT